MGIRTKIRKKKLNCTKKDEMRFISAQKRPSKMSLQRKRNKAHRHNFYLKQLCK